jgi:hypothetical protein
MHFESEDCDHGINLLVGEDTDHGNVIKFSRWWRHRYKAMLNTNGGLKLTID